MTMKEALEQAIAQRYMGYKLVFAVTFYFEKDDTEARKDAESFINAGKRLFGLKDVNVKSIEIPADINVTDFFQSEIYGHIVRTVTSCAGRKLLLIHYAGHGVLDAANDLTLVEQRTPQTGDTHIRQMPWENVNSMLLGPTLLGSSLATTDIAFFLDCCYAGRATRGEQLSNRTVEIIAATDSYNPTNDRQNPPTFTQRVIHELQVKKDQNESATLSQVFDALTKTTRIQQSLRAVPTYRRLVGRLPILLPLDNARRLASTATLEATAPAPSPALIASRHAPEMHTVALLVHTTGHASEDSTKTLIEWLLQLPTAYGVEVNSVHESLGSTIAMLTVPYQYMHIIFNLQACEEIDVTIIKDHIFSENLLPSRHVAGQSTTEGAEVAGSNVETPVSAATASAEVDGGDGGGGDRTLESGRASIRQKAKKILTDSGRVIKKTTNLSNLLKKM
ncbi:hypothetical protein ABW21_db0205642 [Orbilia brochopaga]|nr:hypothetical protein ABW21_db0205642 [Drechslerella brochopaga]